MRTKQVIALLSGSILFLTSGIGVFAQSPFESLGNAFESIFNAPMFQNFFERLASGTDASVIIWAKFMIWALLFAVLSFAIGSIPRLPKKTANIVAGIISLISIIAIPSSILVAIFETYSVVVSFILLLIPVVLVIFLHLILKRTLQNSPRIAHLCGALLSVLVYGLAMLMVRTLRVSASAQHGPLGASISVAVVESPIVALFLAALLIWAIWDIVMFMLGGEAGRSKAASFLKGKALGALGRDTPATGSGSDPLGDLHSRVGDVGARIGRREARSVDESREERRILNTMSGLESESAADLEKIEQDLNVIENALESIKSAPDLSQKQTFLRQVRAGIQKVVPEYKHIQDLLMQLETDLSLVIRLERGEYKELGKDNVDTQEIDRILRAHPDIDNNNMKKIRKKIRKELMDKARLLQRQYQGAGQEQKLFKKLELKLQSFQLHMSGIVTSLSGALVDQAIGNAKNARNDIGEIKQLYGRAATRNGQIYTKVQEFLREDKINKLIKQLTR